MKIEKCWSKDGFVMRTAKKEDREDYYSQNFNPLDRKVARLTGCKEIFSREEILSFFQKCLEDEDRYLFLVFDLEGHIIGESVLNEIDPERRCANFRIGIFHSAQWGKGIGTWMVKTVRDFAFGELKLHRLELSVFSFNPRARAVYKKAGFQEEGVRRDAVLDGGQYADEIQMALLEDEWREEKGREEEAADDKTGRKRG